MTEQFERDLKDARHDLKNTRTGLLDLVDDLGDEDLRRQRRGGWTVAHVLQHIIDGEWRYADMVCKLQGDEPPEIERPRTEPATANDAIARLRQSRAALLVSLHGVDDEHYYEMDPDRPDGYSICSVLENVNHHDGEHRAQIEQILAGK